MRKDWRPARRGARLLGSEFSFMPLSFGAFGKAVVILVVVAFVLWLIFTYMFASEEAAVEAEQLGGIREVQTLPS